MLWRVPFDIIRHILLDFLTPREICALRIVCRTFQKIPCHETILYDHLENNMSIMYTQSWLFRSLGLHMGLQCRTCESIFKTEQALHTHLKKHLHYYPLTDLSFRWHTLSFHVRTVEDIPCVERTCSCPSKRWTEQSLRSQLRLYSSTVRIYTRGSMIYAGVHVLLGRVNGLRYNGEYYTIPYIFLNFLNIYIIRDHLWVSFYHSYDELCQDSRLLIPVHDIQIENNYEKT